MAAVHTQHMQKALDQMNIQLHHVISDIPGTTGLAIVDALLAGERDPKRLALLRDPRIAASEHPLPKWQLISRSDPRSRPSSSAACRETYWWLMPWKP